MTASKADFCWDSVPTKTTATADPAAGANPAAITVPAGKRWKFHAFYLSMVTSVDVATRYCTVVISDGARTMYSVVTAGQAQSLTWMYTFGVGLPYISVATNGYGQFTMPDFELNAGSTITITFTNIQAADNCTAVSYAYKEVPA